VGRWWGSLRPAGRAGPPRRALVGPRRRGSRWWRQRHRCGPGPGAASARQRHWWPGAHSPQPTARLLAASSRLGRSCLGWWMSASSPQARTASTTELSAVGCRLSAVGCRLQAVGPTSTASQAGGTRCILAPLWPVACSPQPLEADRWRSWSSVAGPGCGVGGARFGLPGGPGLRDAPWLGLAGGARVGGARDIAAALALARPPLASGAGGPGLTAHSPQPTARLLAASRRLARSCLG